MGVSVNETESWKRFRAEEDRREVVRIEREGKTEFHNLEVYHGGPKADPKEGVQGSLGWNVGDIDFDPDGSIFIRNPYLANAIERCIAKNYAEYIKNGGRAELVGKPNGPKLFRLTRDEGWSGEKQNIVC